MKCTTSLFLATISFLIMNWENIISVVEKVEKKVYEVEELFMTTRFVVC
jgi:hypothetical protein